MAYVRKTQEMIDAIRNQVRQMKDKALTAYSSTRLEIGTPIHTAFCESIQTVLWSDAPELRGKMPTTWLRKKEQISCEIMDEVTGRRRFSVDVNSADGRPHVVPPVEQNNSWRYEVKLKREHMTEIVKAWVDAEDQRNQQRQTIAEQYNTVEQQLLAFMAKHSSLNSALKEMPEIEMYVPRKYIDKFNEVEIKAPKQNRMTAVDELGIDTDAIASLAIAHRITTAGY